MRITDVQHFRKTVAGIAMIGAPLCGLVSGVLYPPLSTDETKLLASVADDESRFSVAVWFGTAAVAIMLLAVLGLVHLLRERRPGLAHVGGGMAVMGLVGVGMFQGVDMVIGQMVRGGADRAEMAALLSRVNDQAMLPGIMTIVAVAGIVVLAVAAWRAHVMAVVPAACIVAWAVMTAAGYGSGANGVMVAGWVLMTLGLGATGLSVLTETDEQWEHAPEVHGLWAMPAHM
jgi:hypothetical protein